MHVNVFSILESGVALETLRRRQVTEVSEGGE